MPHIVGTRDVAAHGRPFAAVDGGLPAGRARLGIAVPQRCTHTDLLATGPPGGAPAAPVARQVEPTERCGTQPCGSS
jgi:hypothetical protein